MNFKDPPETSEDEYAISPLGELFPGVYFPKREMLSPFDHAKKTYGEGLGSLLSRRSEKLYNDRQLLSDVPYNVFKEMPSFDPEDWSKEVPVGQIDTWERLGVGSDPVLGVTKKIPSGFDAETPEFLQGVGLTGEAAMERLGRDPVLDHELSHIVSNAKEERWSTEGPDYMESRELDNTDTGVPLWGWGSPDLDSYINGLSSSEVDTKRREGAEYVSRNDSEAVAYLNYAVRKFGSEFGRPPDTEEEVLKALDLYHMEAIEQDDYHTEGIVEALKRTPWALRIGQYLVKNDTNQEPRYI